MRLLIATPLYPPEPGGPATYAKLLEDGMSGLDVRVKLVKFGDTRKYPKLVRNVVYFFRTYKHAKRADVVLALDPVSTGFPAAVAAHFRKKPFVVKIVGDYAWEQGSQRSGITDSLDDFVRRGRVPFFVAVLRAVQTFVANHADLVIVPSEYLKGIVSAWGIPAEKIEVVYNAVLVPAEGNVPPVFETLARPRIVTIARLVPWKGVYGLIDAVALLRANFPEASLTVVGDGPDREKLETYARARLGGNYAFTGAIPHDDAFALLASADAFVLNSSYEGLSHVLIEALAAGVPVVASRAGGNGEVITNEENGLLVPVGDTDALVAALERIGSDRELRDRLRTAARTRARDFGVPRMLERTKEALCRTLGT